MLFRDGMKTNFPRKNVTEKDIAVAKQKDKQHKENNQIKVNSSKYRKETRFCSEDKLLVRNYQKKSKYDPLFYTEPFTVIHVNEIGNKVLVERCGMKLERHPDDHKPYFETGPVGPKNQVVRPGKRCMDFTDYDKIEHDYGNDSYNECPFRQQNDIMNDDLGSSDHAVIEPLRRPSSRVRLPNSRYFGENFVNE